MKKVFIIVGIVVIAIYLAVAGHIIDHGLREIKLSSFRIGCMSADTTNDNINKCKELAEEKVGK